MRVNASIEIGDIRFFVVGNQDSQEITRSDLHNLITILNIEIEGGSSDICVFGEWISKLEAVQLMRSACDCLIY